MPSKLFQTRVIPDYEGLIDNILLEGTPDRVYYFELFLDAEVKQAIIKRFGLADSLDENDPHFGQKCEIELQKFLGYDSVRCGLDNFEFPLNKTAIQDTAGIQRSAGREYINEQKGLITSWEEFEQYPWPVVSDSSTESLEWYEKNLPDNMCIVGSGGFAHFAEYINWLMGYETLCYALYDNRDLVKAIYEKLFEIYDRVIRIFLQFDRVKLINGSDDMGFRSGPLISPADLREFVLPGHKHLARLSHEAGRPYILHSCGNLQSIMNELIDDVKIDAKHSFEDTIESVIDLKPVYGDKIALLGGIDVDFLCRADEKAIRERVRRTLDKCQPGGGYCLGTGNSVANYIPLENYLIMMDEGRRF
ncbi:hypothetical protein JW935_04910 [candidate division KSB1 bacterium]|nr:hypothetical protein [candidate division KSB1 bacterium]